MTPRRVAWRACCLLLALAVAPAARSQDELPRAEFGEHLEVRLFSLRVRAVDRFGAALPGLGPREFEAEIGGQQVEVVAVDWVAAGAPPEAESIATLDGTPAPGEAGGKGARLVVLFLQTSAEPHRYLGLWRVLKRIDSLLAGFAPCDRVAVVAFQYHLQTRSHFTVRREETRAAVEAAVRLRARPPVPLAGDGPLLVIDPGAARAAAFVEQGLELVGRGLADLPGEKLLLLLGWGLGVEHGGAETPHYRRALRALREASVTVSAMAVGDLVFGVSSNLDRALARIADDTGGAYVKLAPFLDLAMDRLRRSLDGHYVVTLSVPARASGRVRVGLRQGAPTRVHHAPYLFGRRDQGPAAERRAPSSSSDGGADSPP